MRKFGMGLIKSPYDPRDYLVRSFLAPRSAPSSFSVRAEMTPVRNQGQEGSCVGFAMTVGVKEYQERKDYKGKVISLSPRYLYEAAKKISGHTEGTTLKAAMEVAVSHGVCEEMLWPYVANNVGKPAARADQNAAKYKIKSYARVTNIDELKLAIADPKIGATLIGIMVFKGMVEGDALNTGVVPNPGCLEKYNALGGHALAASGYMDQSPYFKNDGHVEFKNSWGSWGDEGYGYLSYKYIKANMIDAFSSVDIDDPNEYRDIVTVAQIVDRERAAWV